MFRRLVGTTNELSLTVLRLGLGVVFFAHGAQKALGWFSGNGFNATISTFTQYLHIPKPFAVLAIAAEFLGGLGLILGLLGRVAAFGIFCNMLVAVAQVHWHNGFFMNWAGTQKGEGFEFHIIAIAALLAIMMKGSGALSIDMSLSRRRRR